jgi:hypothetical protein
MKIGPRPAALLALLGGLLLVSPALAGHKEMPPKLAANGFIGSLEEAKKRAKDEKKVILLYVTPSYFT